MMSTTRRMTRMALVGAVLCATLAARSGPVSASDAPAGTTIPMDVPQSMVLEPGTGRIFVGGATKVAAFSPTGALIGTTEDVYGAYGLTVAGGFVWATQRSAGAVAKIDPVTLAKVAEYPLGGTSMEGIGAAGGKVYTSRHTEGSGYSLVRIDPATGAVSTVVDYLSGAAATRVARFSDSPARILAGETLYDMSGPTPVVVTNWSSGSDPVVGTGDGVMLFGERDPYPGRVAERTITGTLLRPNGRVYPSVGAPSGVAYSPARGGVIASASWFDQVLSVSHRGEPTATHQIDLPGAPIPNGVALATDASKAYVVYGGASYDFHLAVIPLAPTVASASPASIGPGHPMTRITGTGLGSITSGTLGGQPVIFAHDGTEALEVTVPVLPSPGPSTLELNGPFGSLSIPLTVEAPAVGVVSGRITRNGTAVGGATVTLDGPRKADTTVTTDAAGRYSFSSVPAGPGYDLVAVSGSDRVALPDRTLDGAGPWPFDIDLRAPVGTSAVVRRAALPPGAVRRLIVDPADGRVYVSVGDEVLAYEPDGRGPVRITKMWSAGDLQIVGRKLYVMLRYVPAIAEIDLASPNHAVTRTIPLPGLNLGSFAIVGNRAFLADGEDQTRRIVSVDLTTGASRLETDDGSRNPLMGRVDGAPTHFLTWSTGGSDADVQRWDAGAADPVRVARSQSNLIPGASEVIASATDGRVWPTSGREFDLTTMRPTGIEYPTDANFPGDPVQRPVNAIARSSALGGVLVFGTVVVRKGAPTATHRLAALPASRSLGLSPDGQTAYVATEKGELVVTDLRPLVTAIGPKEIDQATSTVQVTGAGLGGTTRVTIDGSPAVFTKMGAGRIDVTMPALADGIHEVTVTTPWGTSVPVSFRVGPPPGYLPFESWSALVTRLHTDLTGVAPTPEFRSSWVNALSSGAFTSGTLVETLRRGNDNTANVDPVARLYRAFLGRTPDAGGLQFWVGRKRSKTWSVTRMADSFAASTEFKRKYGSLTNRQFVTRIYTDVLARPADTAGVDFWTRRLDRKAQTRGQVMVGFSESSEYRRKQAENTDVAVAYIFLLGRAPTADEVGSWVARQKAGTGTGTLSKELLGSEEYAEHIGG